MPTHRGGRKPSGRPGSRELEILKAAHGRGDLKEMKTAALNYVKAVHQAHAGHVAGDEFAMVQPGPPPSVNDAPKPKPDQRPPGRMQQLAKLAMSRRAKP